MQHLAQMYLALVGLSALLTLFSIPILRYISDLLSGIGTYHDKEPWYTRAFLLYRSYLYVSIPIVFSVFLTVYTTFKADEFSEFDAMLVALSTYSFFPLSLRILALAKKPIPIDLGNTNWIELKNGYQKELTTILLEFWKEGEFARKHDFLGKENSEKFELIWRNDLAKKFGSFCAERDCQAFKKSIIREKKERWISSVVSMIFIGWLIYIVLVLVLFLEGRDIVIPSSKIPGGEALSLMTIFLLLPAVYAGLGEAYIKISGGVSEDLKTPSIE